MESLLITGGTGTVGRALVQRAISHYRVTVYSRDEHKQAEMKREFQVRYIVGDVRDRDRLRRALEGVDNVIHAAAMKRVELESDAVEMVKTNVLGALSLIEASQDAGVKKVIALSTDKACQPVSAYGASKLLMEKLILAANGRVKFSVTRFGNFAGSRGSVIPLWKEGGRVPITDPRCTRFWMTSKEAVDLIFYTLRSMNGGELVAPTLPAFRLSDLAEAMGVETYQIGLRPGERLHEFMNEGDSSEFAPRLTVKQLRERLSELA